MANSKRFVESEIKELVLDRLSDLLAEWEWRKGETAGNAELYNELELLRIAVDGCYLVPSDDIIAVLNYLHQVNELLENEAVSNLNKKLWAIVGRNVLK